TRPAQLKSTVKGVFAADCAASARIAALSVTSRRRVSMPLPCSCASDARPRSSMSVASTCAPSRAKASAAARPLPCAAAVTKTRFPLRRIRERDESRYSVVRSSGWTSLAVTRAGEQFVAMIDAHQHFWELGRHDCTWPTPDLSAIYRDCIPAELEALARGAGVRGSVLVQSQESDRDTDYLCDVAQ